MVTEFCTEALSPDGQTQRSALEYNWEVTERGNRKWLLPALTRGHSNHPQHLCLARKGKELLSQGKCSFLTPALAAFRAVVSFCVCRVTAQASSSGACVRESRTQTVCHQVKFPLLQLPVAFAPLIPHMLHYPSVCWLSSCTDSLRLGFWTNPTPVILWEMGQGQNRLWV